MRIEDAIRRRGRGDPPPEPPSLVDLWELRYAKRTWAVRNGAKLPPFDTTGAPVEFLLRHPEIEPNVDWDRLERHRIEALEMQWQQRGEILAKGRAPGRWPFDGGDVPEAFFRLHPEARAVAEKADADG